MMSPLIRFFLVALMAFSFAAPATFDAQAQEKAPVQAPTHDKVNGYLKAIPKSASTGAYAQWGGEFASNVGNVYFKITGDQVEGNWKGGLLRGKIVEFRGTFQIEYEWATPHTGEKGKGIFAVNAHNPNMLIGSFWFTAVGEGKLPRGKYDWGITRTGK